MGEIRGKIRELKLYHPFWDALICKPFYVVETEAGEILHLSAGKSFVNSENSPPQEHQWKVGSAVQVHYLFRIGNRLYFPSLFLVELEPTNTTSEEAGDYEFDLDDEEPHLDGTEDFLDVHEWCQEIIREYRLPNKQPITMETVLTDDEVCTCVDHANVGENEKIPYPILEGTTFTVRGTAEYLLPLMEARVKNSQEVPQQHH